MDVFAMVLIIAAIFGVLIYYNKFFVKKHSINPKLNVSDLLSLFQEHFGEKYEIYRSKEFGSDFLIKKSGDEGIAFKLKNKKKSAVLIFWPFIPDDKSRPTFFWSIIVANSKGKDIKLEIADFIENHSSLKVE
jgi:hypothetical protein